MSKDYSQKSLNEFFDYADRTGMLAKNTVQSRKTATQKLLAVLHGDEAADLRHLDIDDVAARFANRHKADYTAQSLRVYQSRAKSAINDFIAWVDDPSGFKPQGKRNGKRGKNSQSGNAATSPKIEKNDEKTMSSAFAGSPEKETFSIPIPVRDGFMVEVIGLPKDLRASEAQRISGIVMAYATKEDK